MVNERTGAATAGSPYLIHTFEHQAYPLHGDQPFTIGRDTGCDIIVNEVFVSRHHAELRPEGEEYVLHPTGSTPTVLNDQPLDAPHRLQEGDSFLVGTMRFVFTCERLPVAVAVAQPTAPRPVRSSISSIDDRRPTLTFPLQTANTPHRTAGRGGWLWIMFFIFIVAVGYMLYATR